MIRQLFLVLAVTMATSALNLHLPSFPSLSNILPSVDLCANKEIGGDPISLLCIIGRLCGAMWKNDNQETQDRYSNGFFACYNGALGEEQFLKCQNNALGQLLDSTANDKEGCKLSNLATKIVPYVKCLNDEFKSSGVNQTEAVTQVNRCQGAALDLKVTPSS